jgi:purine nucleosidase
MAVKLLLDTDIDIVGDIDDVMCLAYLLAQPACELLGITAVSWDTVKRAMVASAMCKAAGRQVPIYPGTEAPMLVSLPTVELAQPYDVEHEILRKWDHDEVFPRGQAVEFMRQTIRDHPGEVTLLAIGPLTNVALLFSIDPEIPRLLKGLVLMAGMFRHRVLGAGLREWNALLDPHATALVYRAVVGVHRSVGLDVTFGMKMDAAEVRRRLRGSPSQLLRDMTEAWFHQAGSITFHDPLAAATIFDDRLCRFERGTVDVELTSERLQGLTYWTQDDSYPRHEIAVDGNSKLFFDHYFSLV